MLALFIVLGLVYGTGTLGVYRHLAYEWNTSMLSNHEFQSICKTCVCESCGDIAGHHWMHYGNSCRNPKYTSGMHLTPAIFGLVISLVLWLPIAMWFGASSAAKASGLSGNFFAPTPEIKSKEEKKEARIKELEASIAALELENEVKK